jgi:arylsulfatase A-like enzyme
MDRERAGEPPIPLMQNEEIIEQPCDQNTITRRYTEEAVRFIQENRDRQFFVYLAHTMPHTPLYVSDSFKDKSKRGLYGDVIEEIDWSVGQVLNTLKELKLDKETLVIFTSDNGPWYSQKQNGGTAGLLRGSKQTTWEGGMRVPFIARYPEVLSEGKVCTQMGSTMDLFTTIITLAGIQIPQDRIIDGEDILPVLQGKIKSCHKAFYYFWNDEIFAVRLGKYKLHFKKSIGKRKYAICDPCELYDLEIDPSEKFDIASEHIDIVKKMTDIKENFQKELRENAENQDILDVLLKK